MIRSTSIILTIAAILASHEGMSQGLFESASSEPQGTSSNDKSYELGGYARGIALGGSKDYDISSVFGEFSLTGRASRGKGMLFADVRFREGHFFGQQNTTLEVKEAYAGYRTNTIDLYLGQQIVNWGRTDGFNPTDNISPSDYFFLTPDPDDQIMGNLMIRAVIRPTNRISLDIIAIPMYKPSVYRYDLFDMGQGVSFGESEPIVPSIQNSSIAARANFELTGVGFSLSYFRGLDPFYGFNIKNVELALNPTINYQPEHYRKNALGADIEVPVNRWIVRGEIAANLTENYEENMHIPNPDLHYVAGIERSIGATTVIAQYIGKYILEYTPLSIPQLADPTNPMALMEYGEAVIVYESTLFNRKSFHQQEETNHAVMLSLNRSFAYEQLSAELSGYYNITSDEYLVRPALTWRATDELSMYIGGSWMWGAEGSIFDMAGRVLSGAWVGIKYSF